MAGRVEKSDLIRLVAQRTGRDAETVGAIVDATLDEIYAALKRGEPVSLRDFGTLLRARGARELGLPVQPVAAPAPAVRLVLDLPR